MANNVIKITVTGGDDSLRDSVLMNLHAIYKDAGASVDVSNVEAKEPSYKKISDRLGELAVSTIVLESVNEEVEADDKVKTEERAEDKDDEHSDEKNKKPAKK